MHPTSIDVALFPRERMRDITSLRLAQVKTSGMRFFLTTDAHGWNGRKGRRERKVFSLSALWRGPG